LISDSVVYSPKYALRNRNFYKISNAVKILYLLIVIKEKKINIYFLIGFSTNFPRLFSVQQYSSDDSF
jgi:hypothetical protein